MMRIIALNEDSQGEDSEDEIQVTKEAQVNCDNSNLTKNSGTLK